jgi:tetratricopeptide (TPR) repeat protein
MSDPNEPNTLTRLLADRWQVPLALVAAVVGGAALYRLIPSAPRVDPQSLLADVAALAQAGDALAAADAAQSLLTRKPALPPEARAELHDRLAEIIYRAEAGRETHNTNNVNGLLEHDRAAAELGRPKSTIAALRAAHAQMWLGQDDEALAGFRELLGQGLAAEDRNGVLAALAALLEKHPENRRERGQVLSELLADEGLSPGYAWWGLQCAVQDALDDGDVPLAGKLLEQHGERFKNSDQKGYLEYLRAVILAHDGRTEEAEPIALWVNDWLADPSRAVRELDEHGRLASLNRCLVGQIDFAQARPQEALTAFEETVRARPGPAVRAAAHIGAGRALAALGRHGAARAAFQSALADMAEMPGPPRRTLAQLRQTIVDLSDERTAEGDFSNALLYFASAGETDKIASETGPGSANREPPRTQINEADPLAWSNLELAASFARFDEARLASLLWSAIQAYDRVGRADDLRRALDRFVEGRSAHTNLPPAMLRLGEVCEADGDSDAALRWYKRVLDEYPLLGEAERARVNSARVLASFGPQYYPQAEQLLVDLLTDGRITPEARAYREALRTLSEILCEEGRYGEAIARLEDYVTLYPTGPDHASGLFLLANVERRSSYALRDHAPENASPAVLAESRARFQRAAELFGALLRELPDADEPDDDAGFVAQLALLYRADCLFEFNEPDTLHAALTAYRSVAARYERQPAALTAYVQIANIHLRLGNVAQAGCELERAGLLLRRIPDEAFARSHSGNRTDWERFLVAARSSELFRNASVAVR